MDNLEKDKASRVFNTVWDMTKRYCFIPLDDFLWEKFINEVEDNSQKFKQVDEPTWMLYRGIIDSVVHYKETKDNELLARGGDLNGRN